MGLSLASDRPHLVSQTFPAVSKCFCDGPTQAAVTGHPDPEKGTGIALNREKTDGEWLVWLGYCLVARLVADSNAESAGTCSGSA